MKYKDAKNNLEVGDVILSFNKLNTLSKWIAGVTHSSWSHTMMYIGNGHIVESTIGGIQITPAKHYFEPQYNQLILRHRKASAQERKQIVDNTLKLLGKKYGYVQLVWYLFLRVVGKSEEPKWQLDIQPNAMVCSEAIAQTYMDAGYPIKENMIPSGIEPIDFVESKNFEQIL